MTNIANWKMAIEIVDIPVNDMVIFHSYVKLPEGMTNNTYIRPGNLSYLIF